MYPDFAKQQHDLMFLQVRVSSESLLLREDLKKLLANGGHVMLGEDDPQVQIDVQEIEFEFSSLGEQTSRIIYNQSDLNIFRVVFLMPEDATYQFDYTKGSLSVSYAYMIRLAERGKAVKEELFRDAKTLSWSRCGPPVVVTVFGATRRPLFEASRMKDLCGSTTRRVGEVEARAGAVAALAEQILGMLPI